MSGKIFHFGSLLDAIKPGGVQRSVLGTSIDVSSNGTTSVPADALQDVLLKRFEEMTPPTKPAAEAVDAPPAGAEKLGHGE